MISLDIIYCFGSNYGYYSYPDPILAFCGLLLMILMIILIIRQKRGKPEEVLSDEVTEHVESFYIEKDVFLMDKKVPNHREANYKTADKSKFIFIVFVFLFLVGFLLVLTHTPKKYGPPEINPSGWDTIEQTNEFEN